MEKLGDIIARAASSGGILEESSLDSDSLELVKSVAKKRGAGDAPFRVAERERVVYRLSQATAEQRRILKSLGVTGEE
ncbi:MAG TPA: phenylalanine--tRNA ligase subunit alpha, partial [Spirochaetaceae bacterium]|nr:phenylalanine--tRNA ligase subunit alpha [Spirochaetaceae bacterium]